MLSAALSAAQLRGVAERRRTPYSDKQHYQEYILQRIEGFVHPPPFGGPARNRRGDMPLLHFAGVWGFFWRYNDHESAVKRSPYPLAPTPSMQLPAEPRLEQINPPPHRGTSHDIFRSEVTALPRPRTARQKVRAP